jgi:hypothetical protein
MEKLLPVLLQADVFVCVTPVYYFAMSSYLKTFFERTFPLTTSGLETSREGNLRNRLRDPAQWSGKKFISLTVGALRDPAAYEPVNQTFRLIADTLDMELGGQLTRPESHLLPYKLSKPVTLKRIESAFFRAGQEAGATGRLSAKTMTDAALPLSPDVAAFHTYSNIYWQHAAAMEASSTNSRKLQQQVGRDPDILMREMARCLDPQATARLQAVLQFDFSDCDRHYRLAIQRGTCQLSFEDHLHHGYLGGAVHAPAQRRRRPPPGRHQAGRRQKPVQPPRPLFPAPGGVIRGPRLCRRPAAARRHA